MKCLLDTHAYIWWLGDPARISPAAKKILSDPSNEISVSIASFWELSIKSSLGKITLSRDVQSLAASLQEDGLKLLSIEPPHCRAVTNLPFHHRDPFDRMLIAQALTEDFVLLSRDREFESYPVRVVW